MRKFIRNVLSGLVLVEIAGLILLGVFAGFGVLLIEVIASFVLGVAMLRSLGRPKADDGMPGGMNVGGGGLGMMLRGGARFFSAIFLMAPGLITDLIGLLLLIPWPRRLLTRTATRVASRRMGAAGGFAAGGMPFGSMGNPEDLFAQMGFDPRTGMPQAQEEEIIVEARVKEVNGDEPAT